MICTRQHYTPTCYKRFRILYQGKRRERLADKAANIWRDLPPQAKGEMLLIKWEDEHA